MSLPDPTLSFLLPSLHDQTLLQCRIYIPEDKDRQPFCASKGAIIAHPYAPLGGCFDDPVVGIVASRFLKRGFVVLTFNFRGAGASTGRTTWTGKAEVCDYTTVAAFFAAFLARLLAEQHATQAPSSTEPVRLKLVLGGYSYGSLVTSRLPDLPTILQALSGDSATKQALEVAGKAVELARQVDEDITAARKQPPLRLRIPGDETARQSFDHTLSAGCADDAPQEGHHNMRNSLDGVSKRLSKRFKRQSQDIGKLEEEAVSAPTTPPPPVQPAPAAAVLPTILASYILISPLLPPISSLLHMPFLSSSLSTSTPTLKSSPALVIFGGHDIFTSAKKVRAWCADISEGNKRFRWVEVPEAGHFWHEDGVAKKLARAVGDWIGEIEQG